MLFTEQQARVFRALNKYRNWIINKLPPYASSYDEDAGAYTDPSWGKRDLGQESVLYAALSLLDMALSDLHEGKNGLALKMAARSCIIAWGDVREWYLSTRTEGMEGEDTYVDIEVERKNLLLEQEALRDVTA